MLGISIEVVWHDANPDDIDLMELRVSADSGPFRARTRVYALPHQIADLSGNFDGFPGSLDDQFHAELGAGTRHNRVLLAARCIDRTGSAILTVHIEEGAVDVKFDGYPQVAEIVFRFEAIGADQFAAALKRMANNRAGKAHMPAIV